MTDEQLIRRFLDGEVAAFNTLVWRWQKRIYNFVLRYVGEREEAKDLCQKTFIRVYRNLHRLRDHGKFSTWIYQIAVNTCRDTLKNRRRKATQSLEALKERNDGEHKSGQELSSRHTVNPEREVYNRDLSQLLNRALQAIPEEQRVIIVMKEYQGLKFTEIADALQISVNTAKSRMYYGLNALRKTFQKWNVTEELSKYEV